MWPYCSQQMYTSGLPIFITIINGLAVKGRLLTDPIWEPFQAEHGDYLSVSFSYSKVLWPWSGFLALALSIKEEASQFEGLAAGRVVFSVSTDGHDDVQLVFHVRVRIVPTPPRSHRLLWDQYRNLRYPPGYFPRDDLRNTKNLLDWNGDHPHTNFKGLYHRLRGSGYFVEILGEPVTCTNLSHYSSLLIIDPEDEFFPVERQSLREAISLPGGLNIILFADWFNKSVAERIGFLDENNEQLWQPETGGANVPALNSLLAPWNLTLGDRVFDGFADFSPHGSTIRFRSGTSLIQTGNSDTLIGTASLNDQGWDVLINDNKKRLFQVPIFAMTRPGNRSGFVSIFGDSDCLDSASLSRTDDCVWLLEAILDCALDGELSSTLKGFLKKTESAGEFGDNIDRITRSQSVKYSKVVAYLDRNSQPKYRPLPSCRKWPLMKVKPILNDTFPSTLNAIRSRWLSSFDQIDSPLVDMIDQWPIGSKSVLRNRIGESYAQFGPISTEIQRLLLWLLVFILIIIVFVNRTTLKRCLLNSKYLRRFLRIIRF